MITAQSQWSKISVPQHRRLGPTIDISGRHGNKGNEVRRKEIHFRPAPSNDGGKLILLGRHALLLHFFVIFARLLDVARLCHTPVARRLCWVGWPLILEI